MTTRCVALGVLVGQLISDVVENVLYPVPPMSRAAVEDKFRWVTADMLPPENTEEVIRMCRNLSDVSDVRDLACVLSTATTSRP